MSSSAGTRSLGLPLGSVLLIWLGQVVSLLGSGLTSFALGVWTYETTGGVTRFALVMLAATLPGIVLGPMAGALVDRWNRRWVLVISDIVAGLMTLVLAALLFSGHLQPWHAYITTAIVSVANAFQQPTFSVLVSTVVPPGQLGRANGLIQLGLAFSQLATPMVSAWLLATIQLQGVLLIDAITFILGMLPLLLLRIPSHFLVPSPRGEHPPILASMMEGGAYLKTAPGLLSLLGFLAASNFLSGIVELLVTPLVLSMASVTMLGVLTTAGGVGLLAGGVVMSTWGGPKRLILGVLGSQFACGACLVLVGLATTTPLLATIAFCFFFSVSIINGSSQAILQLKVPLELRGRFFAFSGTITGGMVPLAYAIAGPLADSVFVPALRPGGALVPLLGGLIGEGPGRGVAAMFFMCGLLTILLTTLALTYRPLRTIDELEVPCPVTPQ
ncbi:MFS transporter [Pyxidicoccus sp. 3LFB2]